MHLKTRPMHVIWIFGSGFYVRRQVPRSNCCCLRFPHSRTQAHVYTQRNRTQTHTHSYIHMFWGELTACYFLANYMCFSSSLLDGFMQSQNLSSFSAPNKVHPFEYIFLAPVLLSSVFLFLNPLQSSFSTFDLVVHVRARASHLVVALLLSGPSHPQAATTFSRRRRLHNAPLGHTHTHDTLTKPTHACKQRRTYTHIYMHM